MKYYVYALVDPINRVPFYIGKGTGKRMYVHLSETGNSKKHKYIENIRALGHQPQPKIIYETNDEKDAYNTEYAFIQYGFFNCGLPLVNRIGVDLRPPSRKGSKLSRETIEKRSATVRKTGCQRRKIITHDQRLKISAALKGRPGPNKVSVDVSVLSELYVSHTKKQICGVLGIGMGSLNRILSENHILKSL